MKKHFLPIAYLLGSLSLATPVVAQNPAAQPEFQLPMAMGPVLRPQNASSSTMQQVVDPSGMIQNLYIHTWDVFSSPNNSGIAWRRTDAGGSLIDENHLIIPYSEDIDAVIYEDGPDHFVLAAYYYNNPFLGIRGHYYDIYRFNPSGLVMVSPMNFLSASPTFGRINVDATRYGLAMVWCEPGAGIFTQVASLPGSTFGPAFSLPGTANNVDPDICIRRGAGGSGSGLDLQIVFLDNSLTGLREYRLPFFNALAGSASGFTPEFGAGSPPGSRFFPPRIDCPDAWGGGQRWTVTMGSNIYTGGTVTEWIDAVVMNEDWTSSPSVVNISGISYPVGSWPEPCDPVIAYNRDADVVTIGWMSQQNTWVIPGTADKKYLAMDILDNASGTPAVIPGSFNMISNTPASYESVLAFSGQNLNSDFDGLHTAFSQYHPSFPNYCMLYKSRPFGLSTFSDKKQMSLGDKTMELRVSPNPFNSTLSFVVPAEGNYSISLTSVEGRVVYTHKEALVQGQRFQVDAHSLASGTYIMNIRSVENNINKTEKLVKP